MLAKVSAMALVVVGLLLSLNLFVSRFRSSLSRLSAFVKRRPHLVVYGLMLAGGISVELAFLAVSGEFWKVVLTKWWHLLLGAVGLLAVATSLLCVIVPGLATRKRLLFRYFCALGIYTGALVCMDRFLGSPWLEDTLAVAIFARAGYFLVFNLPVRLASWFRNDQACLYVSVLCIALASAIQIFVLSP